MEVTITKDMSAEEANRLIGEMVKKREELNQRKKEEALKKASGLLKRLNKSVDEIMDEIREGWM